MLRPVFSSPRSVRFSFLPPKKFLSGFYFILAFLNLSPIHAQGEEPALLNIKKLAPGIIVEMRYATTNNFTGKKLYQSDECLLVEPAAKRLARVQKKLEKKGLGLKIWDCYRPISVQQKLWDTVPDNRYVANPKTGSRHNRGASVDLTLVDKNGKELKMPTPFDSFKKRAHRDYQALPKKVLKNRKLLEDAMQEEGFMGLPTEWWHFDDPEWARFSLRNDPVGSASLHREKLSDKSLTPISKSVQQLIVVTADGWDSKAAELRLFDKVNGRWTPARGSIPVTLGKKGLAWGQGLHVMEESGHIKREGDLKAPAGAFAIGEAFGEADRAPASVRWPYRKVGSGDRCVDDPKSSHYNRLVENSSVKKDWKSAEKMKRRDHVYEWGVVINHNFPAVLKGAGSCIFFHIWRKPGAGTEGCTAMEKDDLLYLMNWLEPDKNPVLVQLPRKTYSRLKKKWSLPAF